MPDDSREETEQERAGHGPSGRNQPGGPIPERRFSINVKKTRQVARTTTEESARKLPFEIEPHRMSSRPISLVPLNPGMGYHWVIRPVHLKGVQDFDTELDVSIPRLKIWEAAQIQPVTPLHEQFESAEIGLPPRPLFSVEPIAQDRDETSTESPPEEGEDSQGMEGEEADDRASPSSAGEEASQSDDSTRAPPSLTDLLFEIPEGSLETHEPLCIVAEKRESDRYKQTLETLCREEFRQKVGGRPLADLLSPSESESIDSVRIQNRLVSYDDSESDFFDFVDRIGDGNFIKEVREGGGNLSKLYSRIDEFFTQTLGYLLLFVDEQYAGDLNEHLRTVEDIRESNQIISLRLRELPDDVKRELVRFAWGNVYIETSERDLDALFHSAEDAFRESLAPQGVIEEITRHDPQDAESLLHYWIKGFVVSILLEQENFKPVENHSWSNMMDRIRTEEQPWGDAGPRPDVYNDRSGEVYEIETLYQTDHRKINRTINKYEGVNVKGINIVLPNLTCLRNFDDVYRKNEEKFGNIFKNNIRFWTLDVGERELLQVDEIAKTLKDLYERSAHLMEGPPEVPVDTKARSKHDSG